MNDPNELESDLADMAADAADAELDKALAAADAARAVKHAKTETKRKRQRVTDLGAIAALEAEYGDTNVAAMNVAYVEGLPTMVAVRTPTDPEMKRYRHRLVKGRKPGAEADPSAGLQAAEELADVCLIYPDADTYAKLRAARPGIHLQLGNAASKLSTASAESEGKA